MLIYQMDQRRQLAMDSLREVSGAAGFNDAAISFIKTQQAIPWNERLGICTRSLSSRSTFTSQMEFCPANICSVEDTSKSIFIMALYLSNQHIQILQSTSATGEDVRVK
ncbi:hypothetical protein Q8A67_010273 [Cirrhinus molitorella]|uniref:Uncharacterized protein n=1 Tax=Cirrhinus molitorella TaxID=172907 RepID=A0AA88PZ39_9TELE|nr:hypothetical protein Q8A67_010273 [Cirrhinus molitorella]